ncbi:carbohydrate kinase family protein [Candidatus Similichlamydia laticola]|uniref:Carbohydrate kinase PfkB domain-containing protein n=1 Tax=Candidatus Similichlamydia laticola TaxID=2170265 RepID=A0A369KC99_9BACT|nr:carbohydrate kinase family protein [Candidatus Similichlamydia laticola]RDB31538.1 hypothetical protein HAT2_00341 [Candidatus Similichlamydia laticola]
MTESSLAYLSVIGFFLPIYDCFVPMSRQDQPAFLEEYFNEIDVPFQLNSYYKLDSDQFDRLLQKIESKEIPHHFSVGSILLNVLQHLAKAGVSVDIGTSHGADKIYSGIESLYDSFFKKKFFKLTSFPPPRLIYLYSANDHNPVVFFTTPHSEGLSESFPELIPSFSCYNLVSLDGHILPFSYAINIVERAHKEGVPVAVNCGKKDFLKKHKDHYLAILPMVSMFACNLEEAEVLTGLSDVESCAIALQKKMMPKARVLVTNESMDFCLVKGETAHTYKPVPFPEDKIVHPMGCGDAAAAGFFLSNLLELPEPVQANLIVDMGCSILESPTTVVSTEIIRNLLIKHQILRN